jgi:hypothetical protein
MATSSYMRGRWNINGLRQRPNAVAWSNNPGTVSNGLIVPAGVEKEDFIILSDHNRQPIQFTKDRIENRKRMINGAMRSYFVADKLRINWQYNLLPSRSYSIDMTFNEETGKRTSVGEEYTADGGAGGVDLLEWYNNNPGSFYMFLAYDRHDNMNSYSRMSEYNDVVEVYFSQFDYSVVKRGGSTYDFWDIDIALEEV